MSPESPQPLRVLAYDIRHGQGLDGRLDLDRIARLIMRAEPDLVALQEVDRGAARTNAVDQAAVIQKSCGKLTGDRFERGTRFSG
jgi:endonuclease/exonuclease/phosphatase family metal-dependent hydrolase